jgi:hypothetical protein
MTCVSCTERIDAMLRDLPEFYALAAGEYVSSRQDTAGNAVSIGLSVVALDARSPRESIYALESWERDWRETLSAFRADDGDLQQRQRKAERWAKSESDDFTGVNLCGVVDWLRTHLELAAKEHPAIDEFALEVRQMHNRARGGAAEPLDDMLIIECPGDLEREGEIHRCGKELTIVGAGVRCCRCGTEWDVNRLAIVARSVGADIYRPGPMMADHFGISLRTLQRWRKDGLVRGKGASYHYGDVARVWDERRMTTA